MPPHREKQTEIDGIAAPAVNAGRDQRAGGLARAHRRRRPSEIANTCGRKRKTNEDEAAGDRPLDRVARRSSQRERQQAIRDEAEQKRGEKRSGGRAMTPAIEVDHLWLTRVHHCFLPRMLEREDASYDNVGVILPA